MRLKGKTALITGGTRGIGAAIAEAYAREGARVCVAGLDEAKAKETALRLGNESFGCPIDVTQQSSIDACVAEVERRAGGIDILVNNAAVFDMAPIGEITEESYDRVFGVNVKGLLFTLQSVAQSMVRRGKGGKIVNISSQAGRRGEGLVAVYCASKAAVISITQSGGLGLIRHGINVNGIAPGVIDTDMWTVVDGLFAKYENRPLGEKKRLVGEAVPYGRMGTVDDMKGCAVFLASPESDYIVAQTFNVDGGNWMS
jgi:NAD(P)-dependent dehydrogenase (short-subunit alcohol dehydrogenase family)